MPGCRAAVLILLLGSAATAHADCPTQIDELPATGFLANATRLITEMESPSQPTEREPTVQGRIGAAGGLRADSDAVLGTGSVSGEARAQRGGAAACASADVIASRESSAHVTASGQVPLLFTGLNVGFSLDRDVLLPLSSRVEFLRAPVSRHAWQLSLSFVDFDLKDPATSNHLRVMVIPFTVEWSVASQEDAMVRIDRRTTRLETAMFRFVARGPDGNGTFSLFGFSADWIEADATTPTVGDLGFTRFYLLALDGHGDRWRFEGDGGVLSASGYDCSVVQCNRASYRGALSHRWDSVELGGRIERTGFLAVDNTPAYEDRASSSLTVAGRTRQATLGAFVARTRSFIDARSGHAIGGRLSASQQLSRGFAVVGDGELARMDGDYAPTTTLMPGLDAAGRVLISLAWQKSAAR